MASSFAEMEVMRRVAIYVQCCDYHVLQRLNNDETRDRGAGVARCAEEGEQHNLRRFELLRNNVAAELPDELQRRKRAEEDTREAQAAPESR